MRHFRSLPVLAIRRMLSNWRLLSSVVAGTLVAGAILASTVIYADAIRDLGLEFALEQEQPESLDVRVRQINAPMRGPIYAQSRARIDDAVRGSLGRAAGAVVRQGTSAAFFPSAPGGEPNLDDEARPRANLRFRSELLERTTLTEGRLPAASPAGADGPIEVLVGAETARANGITLGERFDLHPYWDELLTLSVEVVGLLEANDPSERYWRGRAGRARLAKRRPGRPTCCSCRRRASLARRRRRSPPRRRATWTAT